LLEGRSPRLRAWDFAIRLSFPLVRGGNSGGDPPPSVRMVRHRLRANWRTASAKITAALKVTCWKGPRAKFLITRAAETVGLDCEGRLDRANQILHGIGVLKDLDCDAACLQDLEDGLGRVQLRALKRRARRRGARRGFERLGAAQAGSRRKNPPTAGLNPIRGEQPKGPQETCRHEISALARFPGLALRSRLVCRGIDVHPVGPTARVPGREFRRMLER